MGRRVQQHAAIAAVPVPPPDPRPYVPSITLPCNRETAFLALHGSVLGFPMHWVDNQHLPHPRDREWCAGCRLGQSPFWQGYLGVISLNSFHRFILKVPAAAFRESGLFREKSDAGHLAGTVFTAFRFGNSNRQNRPARIELVEHGLPVPKMRPFPLLAALSRFWRMETMDSIDQVQRPEDMQEKVAADFAKFAQRLKAQIKPRKETTP